MRSTMLLHCCVFLFHEQKQYECVGLGSSSIAIWFIPRWCQTWGNLSSWWRSGETVDRRQCIGSVLKIQWWTPLQKWRTSHVFACIMDIPFSPFFLGWVGDITRDIPVCFLTCPLNVVRGEKNKTVTEKRLGWKGTLGPRGDCTNAPTRCGRIRDIVGVARGADFSNDVCWIFERHLTTSSPMFHEQKVKA